MCSQLHETITRFCSQLRGTIRMCNLSLQVELLRDAVSRGFDTTLVNSSGNSAMHMACLCTFSSLNAWRLAHSSPLLTEKEYCTRQLECIRILIHYGAETGARNNTGSTPLEVLEAVRVNELATVLEAGDTEVLRQILSAGSQAVRLCLSICPPATNLQSAGRALQMGLLVRSHLLSKKIPLQQKVLFCHGQLAFSIVCVQTGRRCPPSASVDLIAQYSEAQKGCIKQMSAISQSGTIWEDHR